MKDCLERAVQLQKLFCQGCKDGKAGLDFLIPTQACLAIFATLAKQILQLRSLSLQSSITSLS